jgi:hypothetical protein
MQPCNGKNDKRDYVYGVGLNARGRIIPYVLVAYSEPHQDVVRVLEEHVVRGRISDVNGLRNRLAQQWKETLAAEAKAREAEAKRVALATAQREAKERAEAEARAKEKAERALLVGRFAVHHDGQGVHLAVLLDPAPETLALILTSRPSWARQARPATPEEVSVLGAKPRTFLASVVRPWEEFSLRAGQLSAWRVEALLTEFTRERAS